MSTPSRRLSREESQVQTRQRLIEAASQQVAERGFAATSVRDIAKAAGYTQGAFYSNFESKEALLLDLMRQHKEQIAGDLFGAIAAAGEDFEAILKAVEGWAAAFGMNSQQALLATELYLLAARNPGFGVAYAALMDEQRQAYGQLLDRLFTLAGQPPPAPVAELAGSLMNLARSLATDTALYGSTTQGELLTRVIRSLFDRPAKPR